MAHRGMGKKTILLKMWPLLDPARLQDCRDRFTSDLTFFGLKDLTLDIGRDTAIPVVSTPRSLDLAHLRTALWFHRQEPLTAFITTDDPQRQAARELGLPI